MGKKVFQTGRRGIAPFGSSTSLWRGILVAGLSTLLLGFPGVIKAEGPLGVFSIANLGNPINPAVLENPDVDGVSIRTGWADIEPTEGDFDWSYLDSTVAAAAGAGKQVLLRIGTMSSRPAWVDEAVEAAGGDFFVFDDDGVTTSIPLFWDPVFLAKKTAMIAALGALPK
jgi:Beta-galactosidase